MTTPDHDGGTRPPSLREVITKAAREADCSLRALTVMDWTHTGSTRPRTTETASGREAAHSYSGRRSHRIHIRGLHYVFVGAKVVKPGGSVYRDTDDDWKRIQGRVQLARWLGYVPFDRIFDQRDAPPQVIDFIALTEPHPTLEPGGVRGFNEQQLPDLLWMLDRVRVHTAVPARLL